MKRYERFGLLAIEPSAFVTMVAEEKPDRSNQHIGTAVVVRVQGPLDHHPQPKCELDNYDDIAARVSEACASDASTVVLKVDSPGGIVSGCFELARAIRAKCAAAGKTLIAYVDGHACSAAYAIASAATEIVIPESGVVGSIGVIDARLDATLQDAAIGLRYAFLMSGERKGDGNPHLALSEPELQDRQSLVDALASVFFALVSDFRGKPVTHFESLQARLVYGAEAVKAGLADRVQSFDELIASFAGAGGNIMATKYEEARAALEEAAKGEGEEATRAKKALAAMDEPSEDESEEDKPEEEAAESEEEPAAALAAGTVSAATAAAVGGSANDLAKRLAALEAKHESTERRAFLASRPDLAPAFVKTLAKLPLADVKAMVNAIPKPAAPSPVSTAAASIPSATRGAGQGAAVPAGESTDPELAAVDRAMGFNRPPAAKAELRGNTLYLGRAPTETT